MKAIITTNQPGPCRTVSNPLKESISMDLIHETTEFNPATVKTMTSTQLAEMLHKEKKEVNREIRTMFQGKIDGGIITPSLDSRRYVAEYHLPELESKMFVAKKTSTILKKSLVSGSTKTGNRVTSMISFVKGNLHFPLDKTYHRCHPIPDNPSVF